MGVRGGPVPHRRLGQLESRDVVERRATEIVYTHALRALDAIRLAVAELAAVPLLDGESDKLGFCSRDNAQAQAARALGFVPV